MAISLTSITWLILLGFIAWGAWNIWRRHTAAGVALILITIVVWPLWEWARPHVTHANITGTEVKRVDHDGDAGTPNHDVRYIYANDGGDRQFRNEDAWPWFKLNSDTTFGRAKRLENSEGKAWIVYYGWRSDLFSWHPNVLSVTEQFPVISTIRMIIFYGLSVVLWGAIAWLAIRLKRSADVASPESH